MPSHSTKQAKTMSAIAHGWKPKGSAKDIPVKVAKEFHAADAGHKYGKGMKRGGAIEKALRLAKKAKDGVKQYARGGDVVLDKETGEIPQPPFKDKWVDRVLLPLSSTHMDYDLHKGLINKAIDRRGYSRGGDVDINDTFDPTEGGNIPRLLQHKIRQLPRTWTPPNAPPVRSQTPDEDLQDFITRGRYADGGDVPETDLPLADADNSFAARWYDRAAGAYAMPKAPPGLAKTLFQEGKTRPGGEDKDWSAYGSFGELKGTAPEDTPVAFKTKNPLTHITEGDIDRGLDVGMGAGPGIFVGKFGANALRNAGTPARPHPVYAKEVEQSANRLRPEFRDAYRRWQEDARDIEAQRVLDAREKRWDPRDEDVFRGSGWFRGADGYVRKEIPDYGATLKEVLPGKYALEHPAGDLHKIYDIPPMEFRPGMKAGEAAFYPDKAKIVLGGNPYNKKDLDKATSAALHEIQHRIQQKEGFSGGANPERVPSNILDQEIFADKQPSVTIGEMPDGSMGVKYSGGNYHEPSWQNVPRYSNKFEEHRIEKTNPRARSLVGKQEAYERSAGETEARNVQTRRAKGFRYHEHPEATEDRTRGLQWHDTQYIMPPRSETLEHIRRHMVREYERERAAKRGWRGVLEDAMAPGNDFPRKAGGGGVDNFNPERASAYGLARQGMIRSNIPGRTDKINMKVPTGSYIIPADIPSAIGEGNSEAGGNILAKMLQKGPYGMNLPRRRAGMRVGNRKASLSMSGFAEGGMTEETPIVAAGGEFVVHPDSVAHLGGGDIDLGHAILDDFVKQIREKNINTLKNLKPPKGSE